MRIPIAAVRVEPDFPQRPIDHRAPLAVRASEPVDAQAFLDDLADRQARRERAVGVLEDDLHLAPERAQGL